jgi:hypothetical protein
MSVRRVLIPVAALLALVIISGCQALQELQGQLGA